MITITGTTLNWEDVQLLYIIQTRYGHELDNGPLEKFPSSSHEMFEETIRRFNKMKEEKK